MKIQTTHFEMEILPNSESVFGDRVVIFTHRPGSGDPKWCVPLVFNLDDLKAMAAAFTTEAAR